MNKFGGFGGAGNMQAMLRQAQKMQEEALKAKEELESSVFDGEAGGGVVKVQINGKYEMVSIRIDESIVSADDVEMLEDLIVASFNNAKDKVDAAKSEKLGALGGLM